MDNKSFESFEEGHDVYWQQPDNHALIKGEHKGISYYTILTLRPALFMLMHDDLEYAGRLAEKMIENKVKVFDSIEEFLLWYNSLDTR